MPTEGKKMFTSMNKRNRMVGVGIPRYLLLDIPVIPMRSNNEERLSEVLQPSAATQIGQLAVQKLPLFELR